MSLISRMIRKTCQFSGNKRSPFRLPGQERAIYHLRGRLRRPSNLITRRIFDVRYVGSRARCQPPATYTFYCRNVILHGFTADVNRRTKDLQKYALENKTSIQLSPP